jgi:hypothetical protein
LIATMVIIFLVFVPFFAFRALGEVLSDRVLVRLFFVERLAFDIAIPKTKDRGSSSRV